MIWELAVRAEAVRCNSPSRATSGGGGSSTPTRTWPPTGTRPIMIADVMVVPTGRDIYLSLEARGGGAQDDNGVPDFQVIHSFWVPQLFGKQDVMPGRTNHILFSVDKPGTYRGQCAEFCGLQHGRMKLRGRRARPGRLGSLGREPADPGAEPHRPAGQQGEQLFLNPLIDGRGACTACHAIGDAPGGAAGPNLTHFADPTHACFAGCNWETHRRHRGGAAGVARDPGRGEAGREDARLRADRRRDRCARGLPVQPDVMEGSPRWRA